MLLTFLPNFCNIYETYQFLGQALTSRNAGGAATAGGAVSSSGEPFYHKLKGTHFTPN